VSNGNGVVTVSTDRNNGSAAFVEANGYVFSEQAPATTPANSEMSTFCKRLFFNKQQDATVTITITKSADTSLYFFYWGCCYWGTTNEPYATHLVNTGRGSSTSYHIGNEKITRFQSVVSVPDLAIYELTLINNYNTGGAYNNGFDSLMSYLDGLGIERFLIIPQITKSNVTSEVVKRYWDSAKAYAIIKDESYIDVAKYIYRHWKSLYADSMTLTDYMTTITTDGTHQNASGNDIYRVLLEPIFDLI
jgi:hypothetical protein